MKLLPWEYFWVGFNSINFPDLFNPIWIASLIGLIILIVVYVMRTSSFLGALLMFVLIEAATGVTTAHQFIVGAALVVLILFAPKGLLGTVRERWVRWLP